ncbi:MAG: hypothetical protein ACR2OW_12850, partial [Methyloligellaceae bacterium]
LACLIHRNRSICGDFIATNFRQILVPTNQRFIVEYLWRNRGNDASVRVNFATLNLKGIR